MHDDKKAPRLPAVLLALLLILIPLAQLLMPDAAYSPLEKRELALPPRLTLASGVFSRGMEDYLSDHLPLRGQWVGLDAWRRYLSGSMAADPVWRLPGGALAEAPLEDNGARLERNLQLLDDFALEAGQPLWLLSPPAAGALAEQPGYYPYPDQARLSEINSMAYQQLRPIALFEALQAAPQPVFYRTDPHWNGQGAYVAYAQAAKALGFEPLSPEAFAQAQSPGFHGSSYARSGLWQTPAEALDIWDPGVKLALHFDGSDAAHDSLFFREHLKTPDPYRVFLDGNHGLTRIDNLDNPSGPRLLMLKDSFGNSLLPLLLPHFSHITLLDLRAWRGSSLQVTQDEAFDQLLAVYALKSLATDSNFAWLSRR